MRMANYILLMFCFGVVAYWMGVPTPFQAAWQAQGETYMSFDNVLKVIIGSFIKNGDVWIVALLALTLAPFASGLMTGFSAMFVIPALILMAFAQYFIFPISFLFDNTIDPMVRIPLIFLLNMVMVFAVVDFIRGKN